jgi:hypothetical protein
MSDFTPPTIGRQSAPPISEVCTAYLSTMVYTSNIRENCDDSRATLKYFTCPFAAGAILFVI